MAVCFRPIRFARVAPKIPSILVARSLFGFSMITHCRRSLVCGSHYSNTEHAFGEMATLLKSFGRMCKGLGKSLDRMGAGMQGQKAVVEERIRVLAVCVTRSFALCSCFEIRRKQSLRGMRRVCRHQRHRVRRCVSRLLLFCGLRNHAAR